MRGAPEIVVVISYVSCSDKKGTKNINGRLLVANISSGMGVN